MTTLSTIVSQACDECLCRPPDFVRLSEEIFQDCGVDVTGVTANDIYNAILGLQVDNWDRLAFSCSEVLARYSADTETADEFVRALAAMGVLSIAIRRGYGDWEFSFNIVLRILSANSMRGSYVTRMEMIAFLFCG